MFVYAETPRIFSKSLENTSFITIYSKAEAYFIYSQSPTYGHPFSAGHPPIRTADFITKTILAV